MAFSSYQKNVEVPSVGHSIPGSSLGHKYDVFLSFRGEDTRKTFVDHLYTALAQKAIHTYKDDKTLPRGESITPSLFMAIEESRIAVIVFSKNYAESSWCLEELAYIMKCKDERGLIVMPIFYDVEPSEVRKLKKRFGEALDSHEKENTNKVESWRKALVDASNIAGWEPKNFANGHESEFIKEVVNIIFRRLLPSNSDVDEDFVGMTTRLQDLKSQLQIGSDCVRMVGIWGVGGGGKTTLATSVHTEISHLFEGSCVVENIRDKSSKSGLEKLQKNIISSVLKTKVKVHSITEGKNMLKSMLCRRKVLVVLDDVDDKKQLEALAGSHNWFGRGSRVIITTRDEHLLRAHKVEEVYPIRLLSVEEAIQLFNKHAYNEKEPIKNYKALSLDVISYADGLPLALKVIGSFLVDKDEEGWLSALARLKAIPDKEIVEQLKISYDGLNTEEKELFLDIACFFRYNCVEEAMEIFEACGFYPKTGIQVLRQKALITINVHDELDMHDLVQEMGHYIVNKEHPNNPENRSRVWKHEELRSIFFGDAIMENDNIKAIPSGYHGRSSYLCRIVSNLKRLRWLHVEAFDENNDGGPNFLSNDLRYLHWVGYLGSSFPKSFQPINLAVLKLESSLQKNLWRGKKHLPHLKVLQLRLIKNLVSTPDFDLLPCLEKLTLEDCYNLEKIHPSLGNRTSLEYVQVTWCVKLRMFPKIVHLEKLKTLEISNCEKIRKCPEIQANMESLVNLSLEGTRIEVVPSSIGHSTNLVSLNLMAYSGELKSIEFDLKALKHLEEFRCSGYREKRLIQLCETQFPHSLRKLELLDCNLKDGEVPFRIGELSNLKELNLSENNFTRLGFSLLQLTQLRILKLNNCKRLVELPELPSGVAILEAEDCNSLGTIGDFYRNCKWLCGVSVVRGRSPIKDGGRLLESMLQGKAIESGAMFLGLEGVEMAKGFTPGLVKGDTCRLQLAENWSNDSCGFLMCAVFTDDLYYTDHVRISMEQVKSRMDSQHDDDIDVVFEECGDEYDYDSDVVFEESGGDDDDDDDDDVWEESDGDKCWTWVGYVSFASLRNTCWWDPTCKAVSFSLADESCRKFGVSLVPNGISEGGSGSGSRPTDSSHFSDHKPLLYINHHSEYDLDVSLGLYLCEDG